MVSAWDCQSAHLRSQQICELTVEVKYEVERQHHERGRDEEESKFFFGAGAAHVCAEVCRRIRVGTLMAYIFYH